MDAVDTVRETAIFSTAIHPPPTGCSAEQLGGAEESPAEGRIRSGRRTRMEFAASRQKEAIRPWEISSRDCTQGRAAPSR